MKRDKLVLSLPWHEIESEAQKQIIKNLAVPELIKLAIMPDVHAGYDLPIGGVALLDGAISPSYVGYDIGCGMVHTTFYSKSGKLRDSKILEEIYSAIKEAIPTGFDRRKEPYVCKNVSFLGNKFGVSEFVSADTSKEGKILTQQVSALQWYQLGTLGGGNHFIEIGFSGHDPNRFGLTIHSGSRGCGHKIAGHYMRQGFLNIGSELGRAYIKDMSWAMEYALINRASMLVEVLNILKIALGDVVTDNFINEHHNHAEVLSDGTVLHRKGATPAEDGQYGIIPANMKDGVYITVGLGNEKFLKSASHGAGRKMSRSKAKTYMGDDTEVMLLAETKGVLCPKTCYDEAPWAYKDIGEVLQHQVDNGMIYVEKHFKPLMVVKG